MLPCNVVVQRKEEGSVEVSAVDPVASMQPIAHIVVDEVALRSQLQKSNRRTVAQIAPRLDGHIEIACPLVILGRRTVN